MPTLEHECRLRAAGHRIVAGVDEAGRGPLAGPVVAAAVVLPEDFFHPVLNDSKQLSEKQREKIYAELTSDPRLTFCSAVATVEEIEQLNILRASHLAMERAVRGLSLPPDICLIDGLPVPRFPWLHEGLVGGDALSFSIAAASIIAKVERDRFMRAAHEEFPQYGFASHKGYGTALHLERIQTHGPCPLHRRTFQPIAQLTLNL